MRRADGPPTSGAIDRRQLLRGAGALAALGLAPRASLARGLLGRSDSGRTLVLLQLSGGNDGLSTVVPFGDDAYHRARRSTRLERAEVLPIDDYRGFHPALTRLAACHADGRLALVEGVGYPRPNRSHFASLGVWHTADPRGRRGGPGWVGRLCEARFGDRYEPDRVVHVGGRAPGSLRSERHPPVSFAIPETYRRLGIGADLEPAEDAAGAPPGSALEHVRRVARDARRSSAAIRAAVACYEPRVAYPAGDFGRALRTAAALIEGDLGCRVVSLELGGFDTHDDQRRRHDRQMRTLDQGLGAFLDDLGHSRAGRAAVVLAFSEFGRRVEENGSGGTDHGCAGPLFVLGHAIEGGLHGRHPSLEELDAGDLVFTTDFRSVYATVIEGCFGLAPEHVLGERPPRLAFLG